MADEVVLTPEAEVNASPEQTVTEAAAVVEEKPVGEIIESALPEEKHNLVPESVFLGEKKMRKALEKELKTLKEAMANGASKEEVSSDIDELADEFGVDKSFLSKLASQIKRETQQEIDNKLASSVKEKDKADNFETAFGAAYKTAVERGPEFAAIANPEIIKSLALLPQNSKKTVSQLLEETYGNALTGKRTIETTTPGGGHEPEPLDIKRAKTDTEYFKTIMANPELKKKYNQQMLSSGF